MGNPLDRQGTEMVVISQVLHPYMIAKVPFHGIARTIPQEKISLCGL